MSVQHAPIQRHPVTAHTSAIRWPVTVRARPHYTGPQLTPGITLLERYRGALSVLPPAMPWARPGVPGARNVHAGARHGGADPRPEGGGMDRRHVDGAVPRGKPGRNGPLRRGRSNACYWPGGAPAGSSRDACFDIGRRCDRPWSDSISRVRHLPNRPIHRGRAMAR